MKSLWNIMRIRNNIRKIMLIKRYSNNYIPYENDFSLLKFKNLSWAARLEKYYAFIFFESILHKMNESKKTSCGNVIGSMAFTINLKKRNNYIQKERVSNLS